MTAETTQPDPTAVMVRRAIAHLIDTALYAAALVGPALLFVNTRDFAPGETLDRISQADNGDLVGYAGSTVYTLAESDLYVAVAIALGLFVLVAVVLQGLTGGTIGKFVTGIRTVRADGGRPGIFRALVRSLLWVVDGLPSSIPVLAVPLVGGLLSLVTTGRRRLGDLVARTYVVHRQFTGTSIVQPEDLTDDVPVDDIDAHPGHVTITGADAEPDEALTTAEPDPTQGVADDRPVTEAAWAGDDDIDTRDAPDTGSDEPATPVTSGDKPTEPKWDPQRKAYISYDPRRGGWMQHDTESGEWVPISTG